MKIVNGRFDQVGECWLDEGQKKIHILVETNIHRSHLVKCTVYCEKETNNKRTMVFSVPDERSGAPSSTLSSQSNDATAASYKSSFNHHSHRPSTSSSSSSSSSAPSRKRKLEETHEHEEESPKVSMNHEELSTSATTTTNGGTPSASASSNDFCFYDDSWKFVHRCQKGFPVKSGITHSPLRFVTVLQLQPDAIGLYNSKCGHSTVSIETSQLTFISSQFFMYSKLPEAVKLRKQKSREAAAAAAAANAANKHHHAHAPAPAHAHQHNHHHHHTTPVATTTTNDPSSNMVTDQDQSHDSSSYDHTVDSPRMSPTTTSTTTTGVDGAVRSPSPQIMSSFIHSMFEKQALEIKKAVESQQMFQEQITNQLAQFVKQYSTVLSTTAAATAASAHDSVDSSPNGQRNVPLISAVQIEQMQQFMLTMSEFGLESPEEKSADMYKLKRMRTESNEMCDIHVQPLVRVNKSDNAENDGGVSSNSDFQALDPSSTTTGVVELDSQQPIYLKLSQPSEQQDCYWFCMLMDTHQKVLSVVPLSSNQQHQLIPHPSHSSFMVDVSQKYLHKLTGCEPTHLRLDIEEDGEASDMEQTCVVTLKLFAIPKSSFQIQRRQNRSQWSIYSVPMVIRWKSNNSQFKTEKLRIKIMAL